MDMRLAQINGTAIISSSIANSSLSAWISKVKMANIRSKWIVNLFFIQSLSRFATAPFAQGILRYDEAFTKFMILHF